MGLQRVPLDIVACPDRRLTRAAVEHVAREVHDGQTEVSVLLPDRKYRGLWHRILHDRTAEAFLADLSRLPHANVTTVPYQLDGPAAEPAPPLQLVVQADDPRPVPHPRGPARQRVHHPDRGGSLAGPVRISGEVRSVRVRSQHDSPQLELVVADATGSISLVFLGRRQIAGLHVGSRVAATATVGVFQNRLAMLNPSYELLSR